MKPLKIVATLAAGLVLGITGASILGQREAANRAREVETLRVSLEQAQNTEVKLTAQRVTLKAEVERLREGSQELHRLRGELAQSKRELTESKSEQERLARLNDRSLQLQHGMTESQAPEARALAARKFELAAQLDKLKGREGGIAIENVPPAVRAVLSRETGLEALTGSVGASTDKNGRMTYGFKGQTADNRGIALRLAEDGSILEKSQEIPANAAPVDIQGQVQNVFGAVPISGAREIIEGENVVYELTGKGPQFGMQATVRADGTLLSYTARLRPPERPGQAPAKENR
ncbi:MAG: hypothetical protein FJ403_16905 [Verrucomicrobia bacterium]|nr:hypothetical protein [Verrucomicrobiota bacterium]